MPDVDASLAAYPRQKFRIMQSKHLLITFIISTATVAQSRNLTPDPPATSPPPHSGSSPCLLLYPNPRQRVLGVPACLLCWRGGMPHVLATPTHHMWLAVNKQPTPTHTDRHTRRRTRSNCNQHLGNAHLRQKVCYTCFYLFNAHNRQTTPF